MTQLSLEAEHGVLGAAMYEAAACEAALDRLRPEHFGEAAHGRIWAAVQALARQGAPPHPVAVARVLGEDPGLKGLGGLPFLAELVERAYLWALPAQVEAVADAAARRALLALGRRVAERAADTAAGSADEILAELEAAAAAIARDGGSTPATAPAGDTALAALEAAWRGGYAGAPTGLAALDKVTGGLRAGEVWFVGGRTSMGKSVMGLSLARGVAEQGRGVAVFSLEMPLREVQARLVADLAWDAETAYDPYDPNLRYGDLLKGRGTEAQKDRARAAARRLAELPIAVADAGGLTVDDIRAHAQRQMRQWDRADIPRGALVIDHVGLVRPHTRRGDSKAAETADIVNELKGMAKQLQAPVIALCQVNRNTEARSDRRPTLADLNWSGAIEQIADFICLLYRESYYLERSGSDDDQARAVAVANDLELLIHKNRSGPICNLTVFADVACNVVRDKASNNGLGRRP
jgi:replicative DNA helicase